MLRQQNNYDVTIGLSIKSKNHASSLKHIFCFLAKMRARRSSPIWLTGGPLALHFYICLCTRDPAYIVRAQTTRNNYVL